MATLKSKSSKRSTGTSYASTCTTLIFILLCILGLWLLTSTPFSPPQSISHSTAKIESIAHPRTSKPVIIEESRDEDSKDNAAEEIPEKLHGKESVEEENPEKLHGKESVEEEEKQTALETQASEESSVTQSQEAEQIVEQNNQNFENNDKKLGSEDIKVEEKNSHAIKGSENTKTTSTEISDEDQQQRIEEHDQQQEDDQNQENGNSKSDPNGATSVDQIQHDEGETENSIHEEDHTDDHTHEIKRNSKNKNGEIKSGTQKESKKSWSAQVDESKNQKGRRKSGSNNDKDKYTWQLCNETAGADYIPCLDNEKAISKIHSRIHHEHRERHCPEEPPTCLVPLPKGYKRSIQWPQSRDKIWYHNVPHTSLAKYKGHQNWVKVTGEFITFPGGGTQFIHGALHYIDFVQEAVPDIAWGKHTRVVLDVGCGVASFGGYLFDRDVLTMSFAPKDEHEAQVQFALERGIPAISAVMGSQRLPFPSRVFDLVHCARCRVPWHADGGSLLLELNRVLRPGGYFVWSATPVYQKLEEDVQIWREMSKLTVSMCWELVTIKTDKLNQIGAAIYQKPDSNDCYEHRKRSIPPMCKNNDDPNAAWYVPLQSCMHKAPIEEPERGSQWPEEWPERVLKPPYWLNRSQIGDFAADYKQWKNIVSKIYTNDLGIKWSTLRNVMDMRAVYGGFAAALKDMKIWVMNVVNVDSPDTLPIIYERGLFGIYHDWCESFSTYPRTYDLLHGDHLFSNLKKRCKLVGVMAEIDRIVRPGGILIVRDELSTIKEVENLLKSLNWEVSGKQQQGLLFAHKPLHWRPDSS